jgi:putative cell wall-binding protein
LTRTMSVKSTITLFVALLLVVPFYGQASDIQATQDVTPPLPPDQLQVRPYSMTTRNGFIVSWINSSDVSGIDSIHYTLDVPPTSNDDGESQSVDNSEFEEQFLIIDNVEGTHTVYLWLEDTEGNADFSNPATLRIFSEGEDNQILRVGSDNRYGSAAATSQKIFPDAHAAQSVVLVNGKRPVDALGAGAVAVAAHGSLLYTLANEIPTVTWDELQRALKPGGVVYLVGGTSVIDSNQALFLDQQGYEVVRLAGDNRAETAVDVAEKLNELRTGFSQSAPIAFLVNEDAIADGLSVGPAVERFGSYVLLTGSDDVPDAAMEFMRDEHIRFAYVIGGSDVIGDGVVDELSNGDIYTFRVSGRTRYETSAAIAASFFGDTEPVEVGFANGETLVDALPAAAHLGELEVPVLLIKASLDETRCLPATRFLKINAKGVEGGYAYGGSFVIQDSTTEFLQSVISTPEEFLNEPVAGC